MNELQRFKIPGVKKNIRIARPNKAVEVINLPPHHEENFKMMISSDVRIVSTKHQENSMFIELDSVDQATVVIALYNNIEIGGAK